jgi:glycosyltransferase involved in cell wall biosynthesis
VIRVLSLIHYPVFGGPHNRNMRLAPALVEQGVHAIVLLPNEPGNAAKRLRSAGIDVLTMPLHRLRATPRPLAHIRLAARFWPEVQAIRKVIRERDIDVVQINGLVNPHGAIAARLEGVPVVWQLLDTRPPMVLRRAMMPLVTRLADVVMTTGRAVARVHPGAEALGDRLHVYFPPVDQVSFDPSLVDRGAARSEFGFAPEDRVLGSVGNLNPQKGHEYLIRAAAIARGRQASVRVLIVGASHDTHRGYEESLRRLSTELGLVVGHDLVFAGSQADVRAALAAMDVFALSSVPHSEGAPTVVQEAMMMGLPVVATDVAAVPEVVEHGVTGYVVPPLDPQAIADAALRLVGDAALREGMGRAGRQRALECFSLETCAQIYVEAYDYALRRRGRPGVLADNESTPVTGPLAQAGGASRAG